MADPERVARRMARRLPTYIALDELISSGAVGLIDAADRGLEPLAEIATLALHRHNERRQAANPRIASASRRRGGRIRRPEERIGSSDTDDLVADPL